MTLHTTHGAVTVSLWPDCAPHGARAFLQHSLNRDYDGTPFHRVVADVLVQAGDLSGHKVDVATIRVETHGRLKFRRRGLVALVGDEDRQCGSQFFITLAATPWLNGAHTIIGTIEGDTIFNALALAETAAANSDEPPHVKRITVDENPFPDIIPIVRAVANDSGKKNESNIAAVRNRRLLSFGDDDDDDDEDAKYVKKVKSLKRSFPSTVPEIQKQENETPVISTPTEPASKPDKKAAAQGEFARLLGLARKKKKRKSDSDGGTSKPSATMEKQILKPPAASSKRNDQVPLPVTSRRKRDSSREEEVLRKLANFEKRLTAAQNAGEVESTWFAKPLSSTGADKNKSEDEEDEYVAVEGIPDEFR